MKKIFFIICIFINAMPTYTKRYESNQKIFESFFYGTVGAYNAFFVPLPSLGLGYRLQYNHFGFDLTSDLTALLIVNSFHVAPSVLLYPYPNNGGQFYGGIGCGLGIFNSVFTVCSSCKTIGFSYCMPELVAGYQFKRASGKNNFVEFRFGWPISLAKQDPYAYRGYQKYNPSFTPTPVASIKFGFSF